MFAAADTGRGAALLATGAAPFALAPLVVAGPELPCPFLAATGVPCPLCGATRAVALAAQGDPAFLQFGAVWVVVLLAVAVAGLAALTGTRLPRRSVPVLPTTLAVLAAAWAWALAHAGTIA